MKTHIPEILIVIALLPIHLVSAQTPASVYGSITDSISGEVLIGANIIINNTHRGAVSNEFGFYSITSRASDIISLEISHIAYASKRLYIQTKTDTLINISLSPRNYTIGELSISSEKTVQKTHQMDMISLSPSQIKSVPALGGEADLLKAYQLMPGVQGGNEGSGSIYVRGGDYSQNLILLDGIPLYNTTHLGGLVSVFNPDAIKSSKIIKGSFPARYGNRLSSVVDVRMKDGNNDKINGTLTLGMISSKITLDGPVIKDKSTFLFSARRMMLDVLTLPISYLMNDGDLFTSYTFYDINAKYKHKLSDNDRLYLSFYSGRDKIGTTFKDDDNQKSEEQQKWGNQLVNLRHNHIFGSQLFCNSSLSFSQFQFKASSATEIYTPPAYSYTDQLSSDIKDYTLKTDFEYYPTSQLKLLFGASSTIHLFNPSTRNTTNESENDPNIISSSNSMQANENTCYLENHYSPFAFLSFNLGLRLNAYHIDQTTYYSLEPRLSARYQFHSNVAFKLGYAKMNQNLHLLSYPNYQLPNADIWIPTSQHLVPQESRQASIGLAYTSTSAMYEATFEGYYKKLSNINTLDASAGFTHSTDWYNYIHTGGVGNSYGLEFLLKKNEGQLSGWISYDYSRAFQQFSGINYGKQYPFKYDRPHTFNLVLTYNYSKHFKIFSSFTLKSGTLMTISDGTITSPNFHYNHTYNNSEMIMTYSEKNNVRMSPYHRLDIGCEYAKKKKSTERIWQFSIYNPYNQQNPYYYYWDTKVVDGTQLRQLYQKSLFPIIPSLSYTVKW